MSNTDLSKYEFCIDTALSWDGVFPAPGPGDFEVTIETDTGDEIIVLVSRRYVPAINGDQAIEIALDAYGERHGYADTSGSDFLCRSIGVKAVQAEDE